MAIDLRGLKYFNAIATIGSFTKAADELYVAQPALSLHIKKMEEELGVLLLERTSKGVSPTAAGLRLLAHSQDILARIKAACEDVRDSGAEPTGTLAFGMPQSAGIALTVRLVRESLKRWPKLRLQVVESPTGHTPALLVNRILDQGITFLEDKNSSLLRYRALIKEELVLLGPPGVLGPGHDLDQMPSIDFHSLAGLKFCLPSPRQGQRQLIERYLNQSKVVLKVLAEVDGIAQLLSLVSEGLGYTILTYSAVRDALQEGIISAARIVNPRILRQVYLCRLQDVPASSAMLAVEALIVNIVKELVREGVWIGQIPKGKYT